MKTLKWAAQAALLAPPLFFTAWLVLTLATRGTASTPPPTPTVAAFATFTPSPESAPPGNAPLPAGRPTPLPPPTQPPQPLARLTTGTNLRSGPGAGYAGRSTGPAWNRPARWCHAATVPVVAAPPPPAPVTAH